MSSASVGIRASKPGVAPPDGVPSGTVDFTDSALWEARTNVEALPVIYDGGWNSDPSTSGWYQENPGASGNASWYIISIGTWYINFNADAVYVGYQFTSPNPSTGTCQLETNGYKPQSGSFPTVLSNHFEPSTGPGVTQSYIRQGIIPQINNGQLRLNLQLYSGLRSSIFYVGFVNPTFIP